MMASRNIDCFLRLRLYVCRKELADYFYTGIIVNIIASLFRCFCSTDLSAVTRNNGFQILLAVVYFIISHRCIFGSGT